MYEFLLECKNRLKIIQEILNATGKLENYNKQWGYDGRNSLHSTKPPKHKKEANTTPRGLLKLSKKRSQKRRVCRLSFVFKDNQIL